MLTPSKNMLKPFVPRLTSVPSLPRNAFLTIMTLSIMRKLR